LAKEGRRTPDYSFFDFIHAYVYGRWPYLYIGVGTGRHPLARIIGPLVRGFSRLFPPRHSPDAEPITFADTYHGKVVPLDAATQLVTVQEDVTLTNLEHIIPYALATDIVLKNPDHIVVIDCACRAVQENSSCGPLDVCLVIGEPFASFVIEHHPHRSRWITPQEATQILKETDERGHVHHAFFKDAMLNRFYAICNCCSCCCGAMNSWSRGSGMLASSGYVAEVDSDLCIGCGTCVEACQFEALELVDGVAVVDVEICMGCGVCVSQCDQEACALLRDPTKGEPLVIQELIAGAAEARV
jgi:ferredoxin